MLGGYQRDKASFTSKQCRNLKTITDTEIADIFNLSNNSKSNIILLNYIIYNLNPNYCDIIYDSKKFDLHYSNLIRFGNQYINLEDKLDNTKSRKVLLEEINELLQKVKNINWVDTKCDPKDKLGIIRKLLHANNIKKDKPKLSKKFSDLLRIIVACIPGRPMMGGSNEEINIEKEINKRLNLIIIILKYLINERKQTTGGRKSHKQKTRKYKSSYKLSKTRKPIHKKSRKQRK